MTLLLVLATLVDLCLAAVFFLVSLFVLEGVSHQGPEMPGALFVLGYTIGCVAAPIAGWILRGAGRPAGLVLGVAFAPVVVGAAVMALEPVLAREVVDGTLGSHRLVERHPPPFPGPRSGAGA